MVTQLYASPVLLNPMHLHRHEAGRDNSQITQLWREVRDHLVPATYDLCGRGEKEKTLFPKLGLPGANQQLHSYSQCIATQFNN